MSHDPHEALSGYQAAQIFHDGCAECEKKGGCKCAGIGHLDRDRFEIAWKRAAAWNQGTVSRISNAEVPLLSALLEVQFQLERRGIPIGEVPHA